MPTPICNVDPASATAAVNDSHVGLELGRRRRDSSDYDRYTLTTLSVDVSVENQNQYTGQGTFDNNGSAGTEHPKLKFTFADNTFCEKEITIVWEDE